MSYEKFYQLSVKAEWSHEQFLKVLTATASTGYSDITLILPNQPKALRTIDDFYSLRKVGRDLRIELSISGGNKTLRDLARLLQFRMIEDLDEENSPSEKEYQAANQFWNQPPPEIPKPEADPSLLLAIATIKALLISKGVFSEEEYQQMLEFIEKQWKARPG